MEREALWRRVIDTKYGSLLGGGGGLFGVPTVLKGLMEFVFGRAQGKGGRSSVVVLVLR